MLKLIILLITLHQKYSMSQNKTFRLLCLLIKPRCQKCKHVIIKRPIRKIKYFCNCYESPHYNKFVNGSKNYCNLIELKE